MEKLHETLTDIKVSLAKLESQGQENTRDLKYHIKRTDLLEKKTNYITYLLLMGAGASAPSFIPQILKLMGL